MRGWPPRGAVGTIDILGSFTSAGHGEAADGASIDWQSTTAQSQLRAGTTSAGVGPVRLLNGTVSVVDAVTLAGAFTQQGGTLDGAGTLTLAGPVVWNAGTQQGTGPGERTIITGGLEMTSGTRVLHGRTLVLESNTQWTGGNWEFRGGATIVNRRGAELSFANTWLDDTDPKTTETLINEGTLRKSGAGTATLEFDLFDLRAGGRVEALVGTIDILGSFTSAGHWQVADGATIDWRLANAQANFAQGRPRPVPDRCAS